MSNGNTQAATPSYGGNWIGAAIQSGASLGGSIVNNLWAGKNLEKQYYWNKKAANYQYGKDLEMWHLQNLYNHPKSQMQRMKEAGLNPAMMYGKGSAGAGNAAQMPKMNPFKRGTFHPNIQVPDMLSTYANFRNTQVNSEYQEAKTISEGLEAAIKAVTEEQRRLEWQANRKYVKDIELWKRTKMKRSVDLSNLAYHYEKRKKDLLDAQIDLALSSTKLKDTQIKWMPWMSGATMFGQGVRSMRGLFKKGTAPKLKQLPIKTWGKYKGSPLYYKP